MYLSKIPNNHLQKRLITTERPKATFNLCLTITRVPCDISSLHHMSVYCKLNLKDNADTQMGGEHLKLYSKTGKCHFHNTCVSHLGE